MHKLCISCPTNQCPTISLITAYQLHLCHSLIPVHAALCSASKSTCYLQSGHLSNLSTSCHVSPGSSSVVLALLCLSCSMAAIPFRPRANGKHNTASPSLHRRLVQTSPHSFPLSLYVVIISLFLSLPFHSFSLTCYSSDKSAWQEGEETRSQPSAAGEDISMTQADLRQNQATSTQTSTVASRKVRLLLACTAHKPASLALCPPLTLHGIAYDHAPSSQDDRQRV